MPKMDKKMLQNWSETVVIFDLDGTLVDSAPDLAGAMNHVLTCEGLSPLALEDVRHLVGNGAAALLQRGFASNGIELSHDAPKMQDLLKQFIAYYQAHIADHSCVFEGCLNVLETLKAVDAKLAVCTNKIEALAHPLLEALDIIQYFDVILGRDSLPVYKPDPTPLLECVRRTKTAAGIMIGDTMTDLLAAQAAQMPCYIATFGYGTFPHDAPQIKGQFDHYDQLPKIIEL